MIIIGLAINKPAPVAQQRQADIRRQGAWVNLFGTAYPVECGNHARDRTEKTQESGPILTMVEIEASRFSIPAITSVWNSVTSNCLIFAKPFIAVSKAQLP